MLRKLRRFASTEKSQSVDVTVFGDGFAQVEETRFVDLKAGKNLIQLNGVAGKYRQDSLRIIDAKGKGEFKYKSANLSACQSDQRSNPRAFSRQADFCARRHRVERKDN